MCVTLVLASLASISPRVARVYQLRLQLQWMSSSGQRGRKETHCSSERNKDKRSLSNKSEHHDKEKDQDRHGKTSKREEGKDKDKQEEVKVKKERVDEKPNGVSKEGFYFVSNQMVKIEVTQELVSQVEPKDYNGGGEQTLYIKQNEDEESANQVRASRDSTHGSDTRLPSLHNTTIIKIEEESDEGGPSVSKTYIRTGFLHPIKDLQNSKSTQSSSFIKKSTDSKEGDVPPSARKKVKKSETKTQKKRKHKELEQQTKEGARVSGENPSPKKKQEKWEVYVCMLDHDYTMKRTFTDNLIHN